MNIKVKIKVELEKVIDIEAHDLLNRSINEYVEMYCEVDSRHIQDLVNAAKWELEE